MAEPADDRFDVGARFIQIAGRGGQKAYLPCQARIDWFRHDYPEGIIEQELVYHDERQAIFKATVTKVRDGVILGRADGYGQEYASAFPDYLLKAATVSIGRALNALGFGGSDLDEGVAEGNIAYAPVDRSAGRGEAPTPFEARRPANATQPVSGDRKTAYAPRVTNGKPLSEKQFGKIGVECNERGIDDDARHALLGDQFGKTSRNDLTSQEASAFIDWLLAATPETIAEAVGAAKRAQATARGQTEMPMPAQPTGAAGRGDVDWTVAWKRLRELGCGNAMQFTELSGTAIDEKDPAGMLALYERKAAERDRAIDGEAGMDRHTR